MFGNMAEIADILTPQQFAVAPVSPRALTILILLLAGHALGDFLFRPRTVVHRQPRARLMPHVAIVMACQTALLIPLLSPALLGWILALGTLHLLIDFLVRRRVDDRGDSLDLFVAEQLVHVVAIVLVWLAIRQWTPVAPVHGGIPLPPLMAMGLMIAAYAFNANGGATVVHHVLALFGSPVEGSQGSESDSPETGPAGRGRLIGILERWLVLTLVLVDQWGVVGLVLAAKSIARFDQLKDRDFSEHYLIGTLLSVTIAIITGIVVGALL